MERKIFRIYNSKLLLALFFLVLVEPAYFITIGSIHHIYIVGKILILIFVSAMTILTIEKEKKISKELIWIVCFYGAILFSTVINSGEVQDYIISICSSLAICLIFNLWLKKNPDTLLDSFKILDIYIYINLVTIIMYPHGMYNSGLFNESWFLGFKNPQIRTILPILCIALIRSYRQRSKISLLTKILVVCSAITMILNGSSTGLVGIVFFILLIFLFHKKYKRIPRVFNLFMVTVITIGLFVGIILFRIQEMFSFLIVGILGKDLSFTNRAGIWNTAIQVIKQKILFGYGYLKDSDYAALLNFSAATHPHNYILYIAMSGGVLLVMIWLIGILRTSKKLNNNISSVYGKIILFTLCSFLIMGLTESLVSTELLYPMFILGMKSDIICGLSYQKKGVTLFGKKIIWGKEEARRYAKNEY